MKPGVIPHPVNGCVDKGGMIRAQYHSDGQFAATPGWHIGHHRCGIRASRQEASVGMPSANRRTRMFVPPSFTFEPTVQRCGPPDLAQLNPPPNYPGAWQQAIIQRSEIFL
jgi:hypothetical protein